MIKTNSLKNAIFRTLFIGLSISANSQVIFEDHFDGDSLNMEYWNYEEGDGCPNLCGWGNNERQIYDRKHVEVKDGNLVITAVKKGDQYFSGKINSKDKIEFQYGEIEVRAKLPKGKGIWPAVWMLGHDISEVGWPASGEIDIMEYVGREPQKVFTSLHTPASHGNTINTKKVVVEDIEEGYHLYKAVWTKDFIEFFIDGKAIYKFVPEEYDAAHYPFRKPFYFLINMAVGGNFGGPDVDDAIFPQKFYVDYIKVKQL